MIKNQQEIATPTPLPLESEQKTDSLSQKKHKSLSTRRLTYTATFAALCVVLKIVSNQLSQALPPSLKISLTYLGWYFSAAVLGPLGGGSVALISDVLGQLVLPQGGAVNPALSLGNFCAAFVFGLAYKRSLLKSKPLNAVIGAAAATLIGTLGINSVGLYFAYYSNMRYFAYFAAYRLPQLLPVLVNVVLFCLIIPLSDKLKNNLERND